MRIALIVNPAAGGGTDPAEVAERLRAHGAEVLAEDDESCERIAVAAGDGTLGRVAERAGRLGVPLAVLPAGTANDFARAHDLPADLDAAARLAVTGTRMLSHELATLDDRPFLNVASLGLPPLAARAARPLKPVLGPLAYAAGAAVAALRARPLACEVEADGEGLFSGNVWQVTIAATGAFGGGAAIAQADPADGRLDLVVIGAGPRLALVRRGYGMRRGTLVDQTAVAHVVAHSVGLRVPAGTPFNVDGEVVGAGPAVRCEARAAAFELVVG